MQNRQRTVTQLGNWFISLQRSFVQGNMAFFSPWILSVILYAKFICADSTDKLLQLDCRGENRGVHGQDSLLSCTVRAGGKSMEIISASWRRPGEELPLLMVNKKKYPEPEDPRFVFARPMLSGTDVDVSLLLRNTKRTDEGQYECQVVTDRGHDKAIVNLSVTAPYSKPEIGVIPEKGIQDQMDVSLFCNVSGGYPCGSIQWFDQYNTSWTRSAEMTVVETADKRLNLSSKFTLKASSMHPLYRCVVYNSTGAQVGEAQLELPFPESVLEKVAGDKNSTAVTAVFVVAGSLLCGLIILFLLRRRRQQRARRLSTHPILRGAYAESPDMEEGLADVKATEKSESQALND
ncbi:hypothetical protein GJAV_G00144780 [Gymnothorax javanicus]|nr:hypothetical protein GJAV_G00144780 [Gymnothorax javanicus]